MAKAVYDGNLVAKTIQDLDIPKDLGLKTTLTLIEKVGAALFDLQETKPADPRIGLLSNVLTTLDAIDPASTAHVALGQVLTQKPIEGAGVFDNGGTAIMASIQRLNIDKMTGLKTNKELNNQILAYLIKLNPKPDAGNIDNIVHTTALGIQKVGADFDIKNISHLKIAEGYRILGEEFSPYNPRQSAFIDNIMRFNESHSAQRVPKSLNEGKTLFNFLETHPDISSREDINDMIDSTVFGFRILQEPFIAPIGLLTGGPAAGYWSAADQIKIINKLLPQLTEVDADLLVSDHKKIVAEFGSSIWANNTSRLGLGRTAMTYATINEPNLNKISSTTITAFLHGKRVAAKKMGQSVAAGSYVAPSSELYSGAAGGASPAGYAAPQIRVDSASRSAEPQVGAPAIRNAAHARLAAAQRSLEQEKDMQNQIDKPSPLRQTKSEPVAMVPIERPAVAPTQATVDQTINLLFGDPRGNAKDSGAFGSLSKLDISWSNAAELKAAPAIAEDAHNRSKTKQSAAKITEAYTALEAINPGKAKANARAFSKTVENGFGVLISYIEAGNQIAPSTLKSAVAMRNEAFIASLPSVPLPSLKRAKAEDPAAVAATAASNKELSLSMLKILLAKAREFNENVQKAIALVEEPDLGQAASAQSSTPAPSLGGPPPAPSLGGPPPAPSLGGPPPAPSLGGPPPAPSLGGPPPAPSLGGPPPAPSLGGSRNATPAPMQLGAAAGAPMALGGGAPIQLGGGINLGLAKQAEDIGRGAALLDGIRAGTKLKTPEERAQADAARVVKAARGGRE